MISIRASAALIVAYGGSHPDDFPLHHPRGILSGDAANIDAGLSILQSCRILNVIPLYHRRVEVMFEGNCCRLYQIDKAPVNSMQAL